MELLLAGFLLAQQQPPCGPTGLMEKRIHDEYGESIVGAGMVDGGVLFTLANPQTGTFTVLLRRPDGKTCFLMNGTGFTAVEPTKPGKDL